MSGNPWNQRYDTDAYVYGIEPNNFLRSQAWRLTPGGSALLVADGEGRNGVWMAGQGLDVLSVDNSAVGLTKARKLADTMRVRIATEDADLRATWTCPIWAFRC